MSSQLQSTPSIHKTALASNLHKNKIGEVNIIVQPQSDEIWLANYSQGITVVAASDGHFIKKFCMMRRSLAVLG